MKLHLHLGAHKTATTHFQNVLLSNMSLYKNHSHYVPMEEFRELVTHGPKLWDPCCNKEIEAYLGQLEQIEKQNLIISDENIIGNAKDIYLSGQLYCKMEERLERLKAFISTFSEATIWISVRSMDTFIPSMYCESLLHWRFRPFCRVFLGHCEQSWIPVISALSTQFPTVKINVVLYEEYETVLPKWLEAMTGIREGWNLLEADRPRESLNHLAVKIMNLAHPFVPPVKAGGILQAMSGNFSKKGVGKKYSPFRDSVKANLQLLYTNDLAQIESMGGNVHLFKG